jgi:hypothetical protein
MILARVFFIKLLSYLMLWGIQRWLSRASK